MNGESKSSLTAGILARLRRGWVRDAELGIRGRAVKGLKLILESGQARIALRSCNRVGRGARVSGRMRVENYGSIVIGDAFVGRSYFAPVELLAGPGATIEVGSGVWINFGSVVAARSRVTIGDRAQLGQYCLVADIDVPELVAEVDAEEGRPIVIGADAWLAARVTVRPGVTIGCGTVVAAGSIVETDLPDRVVAGGIPARVLRRLA